MEQNNQVEKLDEIASKGGNVGKTAACVAAVALALATMNGCTSTRSGGISLDYRGFEISAGGEGHDKFERKGQKAYDPGQAFHKDRKQSSYDGIFGSKRSQSRGRNTGNRYAPINKK